MWSVSGECRHTLKTEIHALKATNHLTTKNAKICKIKILNYFLNELGILH